MSDIQSDQTDHPRRSTGSQQPHKTNHSDCKSGT